MLMISCDMLHHTFYGARFKPDAGEFCFYQNLWLKCYAFILITSVLFVFPSPPTLILFVNLNNIPYFLVPLMLKLRDCILAHNGEKGLFLPAPFLK